MLIGACYTLLKIVQVAWPFVSWLKIEYRFRLIYVAIWW